MTIVDKLTPVYYRLCRIGIQRDGSNIVAIADLDILNANEEQVGTDNPATALTPAEKQALAAFIERELGIYETATGLTEWSG